MGASLALAAARRLQPPPGPAAEDPPVHHAARRDHPRRAALLRHRRAARPATAPACWSAATRAGPSRSRATRTTRRASAGRASIALASHPRPVRPGPLAGRHRIAACRSSYEHAVAAVRSKLYDANGQPQEGRQPPHPDRDGHLADARRADRQAARRLPRGEVGAARPVGRGNVRDGTAKAFGKAMNVVYDFTKADVVLSLDADFLCLGPGQVRYSQATSRRASARCGLRVARTAASRTR